MNDTIEVNLRYLIIPDYLYEDNRLSWLQARLYAFVHTFKGEAFYFSNAHLAKMFKAHEVSITDAFTKLKDYGYVKIEYKVKANGGKVRYISDAKVESPISLQANSELASKLIPNKPRGLVGIYMNDNKINDNKKKESVSNTSKPIQQSKPHAKPQAPTAPRTTHLSYLENIPIEDLNNMQRVYKCAVGQIKQKAEKLLLTYKGNPGKAQGRDFKFILERVLLEDFGKRTTPVRQYGGGVSISSLLAQYGKSI